MILRGWLYFLARLLGDLQAIQRGRVGRRIARRAAGKLTGRWFRRIFGAWLLLGLGVAPAVAQERVDLFDAKGKRAGYAVIDEKSGRVDLYDVKSRRTGWGRLTPIGRVELFNLDGKRQGEAVLPPTMDRRQAR